MLKACSPCLCVVALDGGPSLVSPVPQSHTQAHTTWDVGQALTPFLWFAFIFSRRTGSIYTKGASQQGFPLLFLLSLSLSLAVACPAASLGSAGPFSRCCRPMQRLQGSASEGSQEPRKAAVAHGGEAVKSEGRKNECLCILDTRGKTNKREEER